MFFTDKEKRNIYVDLWGNRHVNASNFAFTMLVHALIARVETGRSMFGNCFLFWCVLLKFDSLFIALIIFLLFSSRNWIIDVAANQVLNFPDNRVNSFPNEMFFFQFSSMKIVLCHSSEFIEITQSPQKMSVIPFPLEVSSSGHCGAKFEWASGRISLKSDTLLCHWPLYHRVTRCSL